MSKFKPGQSGNPAGRPKGARHKLGGAFLEALHDDFDKHGIDAIRETREADPAAYVRVIASLLPKEIKAEITRTAADLSDDELAAIARNAFGGSEGDTSSPNGSGQSDSVH